MCRRSAMPDAMAGTHTDDTPLEISAGHYLGELGQLFSPSPVVARRAKSLMS